MDGVPSTPPNKGALYMKPHWTDSKQRFGLDYVLVKFN